MINKELKDFLKFLKKEKVIEKYEELFDEVFDFDKLITFNKLDTIKVMYDKDLSAIRLYEIIHRITIDEELINMYLSAKEEIKKYIIRVIVSDVKDKKELISILINGDNASSIKYAYSLTTKDKLKNDDNLKKYVELVASTKEEISYELRELIEDSKEKGVEIPIQFLGILSDIDDLDIFDYVVDLYNEKGDFENNIHLYMSLSLANSKENANNAFLVLTDENLKDRKDLLYIALSIATCDTEFQSKKGLEIARKYYDNNDLLVKVLEAVNERNVEGNLENIMDVLKCRNLDTIIYALTSISDNEEITERVKVKVR